MIARPRVILLVRNSDDWARLATGSRYDRFELARAIERVVAELTENVAAFAPRQFAQATETTRRHRICGTAVGSAVFITGFSLRNPHPDDDDPGPGAGSNGPMQPNEAAVFWLLCLPARIVVRTSATAYASISGCFVVRLIPPRETHLSGHHRDPLRRYLQSFEDEPYPHHVFENRTESVLRDLRGQLVRFHTVSANPKELRKMTVARDAFVRSQEKIEVIVRMTRDLYQVTRAAEQKESHDYAVQTPLHENAEMTHIVDLTGSPFGNLFQSTDGHAPKPTLWRELGLVEKLSHDDPRLVSIDGFAQPVADALGAARPSHDISAADPPLRTRDVQTPLYRVPRTMDGVGLMAGAGHLPAVAAGTAETQAPGCRVRETGHRHRTAVRSALTTASDAIAGVGAPTDWFGGMDACVAASSLFFDRAEDPWSDGASAALTSSANARAAGLLDGQERRDTMAMRHRHGAESPNPMLPPAWMIASPTSAATHLLPG